MTEATRIHVTLLAVAFAAVGVSVLAIYVAPTWLAMLVGLACWLVVGYVVVTGWGYGKLGRQLSQMEAADAAAAQEAFFSRYPWLRRRGQQANSTPHTDAKLPPV
jgi:fatty acid desaturase